MTDSTDLATALRRVISASRVADFDGLDLADAIADLEGLAARLEAAEVGATRNQAALRASDILERLAAIEDGEAPSVRRERAHRLGVGGFFPYSPYVGAANPVAPPVRVDVHDAGEWAEVRGEHVFDAVYNGPPDGVHGGVIAGVFDDLLGAVCVVNDVSGFTGTLTIRYRSLTPLGVPIRMRSWVEGREGRKAFARGTFHHGDTLCAEAEGVFIGTGPGSLPF